MHVAGYGPSALGVAGRVGDGVIIQLADPEIIEWTMATARKAAEEAGRDPAALKCLVCAPSKVSRRHRRRARRGPLVPGDGRQPRRRHRRACTARRRTIPRELTDYIKGRDAYDYKDHSRVGAEHGEFVAGRDLRPLLRDRLGRAVRARSCAACEAIGVDEWIVYLMTEGQDETLEAYGAGDHPRGQLRRAARRRGGRPAGRPPACPPAASG